MPALVLDPPGALAFSGLSAEPPTSAASSRSASTSALAQPADTDGLADDVLLQVLRYLAAEFGPTAQAASLAAAGRSFAWFRRTLPLVCRRWARLLSAGGKFSWSSVVVSVEQEVAARRRRPDATYAYPPPVASAAASGSSASAFLGGGSAGSGLSSGAASSSSPGSSSAAACLSAPTASFLAGSSPSGAAAFPPASPSQLHAFRRPAAAGGPRATLRGGAVAAWLEARGGGVADLCLDLAAPPHDLGGGAHGLEALLRAANRGPRGVRSLRLSGAAGLGGPDSYDMLARLRGLADLAVEGLPQGFLAATLPHLSALTGLTRLAFTPEALQFPVTVPALPTALRCLSLSQLWLARLPPLASSAPALSELHLLHCCLVDGALEALAGAAALAVLRLDGSSLTTPAGGRAGWDAGRPWPPCPGLRRLSMAACGLAGLPRGAAGALPALEVLDVSGNPDLGGAATTADAATAAAASSGCLPPELAHLAALADVRLAGCGLTALPAALLRCPAITALDLSSNALSALPLPPPPPPHHHHPRHHHQQHQPHAASQQHGALPLGGGTAAAATAAARPAAPQHSPPRGAGGSGVAAGGGGGGGNGGVACFAGGLVRLNIAMNRFTAWPQGLAACSRLTELVVGAPLVARAGEGELERCAAALPRLARLEVRGASFEPRAVRALLALQRWAAAERRGQLAVEAGGA